MIRAFSGKGIIPAELLDAPLLASIVIAAAITVLLATRLGFPVSTTHALVGGIAGAGIIAAGGALEFLVLARAFALPLLVGPILAVGLAYFGLRLARRASRTLGIEAASCLCLTQTQVQTACPVHGTGALAIASPRSLALYSTASAIRLSSGIDPECRDESVDRGIALTVGGALTLGHLLSAALVGFARGLNDTPKIVGLIAGVGIISISQGTIAVALTMATGGLISARRVAETLSHEITPMTPSQGLVGNLATSGLGQAGVVAQNIESGGLEITGEGSVLGSCTGAGIFARRVNGLRLIGVQIDSTAHGTGSYAVDIADGLHLVGLSGPVILSGVTITAAERAGILFDGTGQGEWGVPSLLVSNVTIVMSDAGYGLVTQNGAMDDISARINIFRSSDPIGMRERV